MALRLDGVLEHCSLPFAYSFWASMMIRVLSFVLAVEGCMPTRERKDVAEAIAPCSFCSFFVFCCVDGGLVPLGGSGSSRLWRWF